VDVCTRRWNSDTALTPEIPAGFDSPNSLVLAFGPSEMLDSPEPFRVLCEAFPQSILAGCSTSGQILGDELFDDAFAISVARFEHTELRMAAVPVGKPSDSFSAGQQIGEALADADLRAVFVLSEGLGINGSELVHGLRRALDDRVLVTGGLAGDADRFQRTWVLVEGAPRTGWVSAVGFYGDRLRVGHGSVGGWSIFGPERVITRSTGNVLYELDGHDALSLYENYLGELANDLPASGLLFPLAIREGSKSDNELVRTILAIDREARSLTFAGNIPQGGLAKLMTASPEHLVVAAASAATDATNVAGQRRRGLAIAVSCVGRRLLLGEATDEELTASQNALGPWVDQVGFYSYGELAPGGAGHCDLHNQTMTFTVLGEG
jgi:hypothetical protein